MIILSVAPTHLVSKCVVDDCKVLSRNGGGEAMFDCDCRGLSK